MKNYNSLDFTQNKKVLKASRKMRQLPKLKNKKYYVKSIQSQLIKNMYQKYIKELNIIERSRS